MGVSWLVRVLVPFLRFQYGQPEGLEHVLCWSEIGTLLEILKKGKLPVHYMPALGLPNSCSVGIDKTGCRQINTA